MKEYLDIRRDGLDADRLQKVLSGEVFRQVIETLLRNLYWWTKEAPPAEAAAYQRVNSLIGDEFGSLGLCIHFQTSGTVLALDGTTEEKAVPEDNGPEHPPGESIQPSLATEP